jgi:hypothetical protein
MVTAQPTKRICVIGSSTAFGYFPSSITNYTSDSGWVAKLNNHYKAPGIIDTTYNIAVLGSDCYSGMPTSFIQPLGENSPNINGNISRAVSLVPKPTVIVINYSNNNYERLSNDAILQCLQTMKDTANVNGINCYITTTQPRNSFDSASRQKLLDLSIAIKAKFGYWAIDFFNPMAELPSLNILPVFDWGDLIHINPLGHTLLAQQVIDKNIFSTVLPLAFTYFNISKQQEYVQLQWGTIQQINSKKIMIQSSEDGGIYTTIHTIFTNSNSSSEKHYSYRDSITTNISRYYRIVAVDMEGLQNISRICYYKNNNFGAHTIGVVYPVPSQNNISIPIYFNTKQVVEIELINSSGYCLQIQTIQAYLGSNYTMNIQQIPKGVYYVKFKASKYVTIRKFIKI